MDNKIDIMEGYPIDYDEDVSFIEDLDRTPSDLYEAILCDIQEFTLDLDTRLKKVLNKMEEDEVETAKELLQNIISSLYGV